MQKKKERKKEKKKHSERKYNRSYILMQKNKQQEWAEEMMELRWKKIGEDEKLGELVLLLNQLVVPQQQKGNFRSTEIASSKRQKLQEANQRH